VFTENQGFGAPIGLRGFHEDATQHDGVDDEVVELQFDVAV
jgi:hypothetical protein